MSYRHRQDAQRDAKDACGTCIRSENRSKRSTRTDMTFVHLRSTKSRGHLSRITTPGLTSRRVAPRVMHSPPPALAARNEKKQSLRGENIRAGGRAHAHVSVKAETVVNTRFQSRHLIWFSCSSLTSCARRFVGKSPRKPRVLRTEWKAGCVCLAFVVVVMGSVGCIVSSSSNVTLAQEVSEKHKTRSSSLIFDDVRRHSSSGIGPDGCQRRLEGGATKPRLRL